MNVAEKEVIETFCRELALVLRRVTGKEIDVHPDALAKRITTKRAPSVDGTNKISVISKAERK